MSKVYSTKLDVVLRQWMKESYKEELDEPYTRIARNTLRLPAG